jgi:hypothetical protein
MSGRRRRTAANRAWAFVLPCCRESPGPSEIFGQTANGLDEVSAGADIVALGAAGIALTNAENPAVVAPAGAPIKGRIVRQGRSDIGNS